MRNMVIRCALLIFVGVFAFALAASADTIELKDHRVIEGRYMGGSQTHIRFLTNGKIELYAVADIVALTFSGGLNSTSDAAPTATPSLGPRNVTVPAGTRILVRMIDSVDSEKNHIGDRFRASLEQDLVADGVLIATRGADVYGRLTEAKGAGHIAGKSQLRLELTGIVVNGQLQNLTTGDYEVSGKSRGSDTAKKVGGGAAIGAVIGAIAGGGKGAAIGAGVGAGAGTTIQVLTKGEQVRVPSETVLEFRIDAPLTVEAPPAPR